MTVPLSSVTVSHLLIVAVPTPDGATFEIVTVPEALAVHWSPSLKVTVPSSFRPLTIERLGDTLLNRATIVPSTVTSNRELPLS